MLKNDEKLENFLELDVEQHDLKIFLAFFFFVEEILIRNVLLVGKKKKC